MSNRPFFNFTGQKTISEIVSVIGAQIEEKYLSKASATYITDIKNLEDSALGDLSFVSNKKYYSQLENAKCSACIIPNNVEINYSPETIILRAEDPYFAYSKAIKFLYSEKQTLSKKTISESAKIGKNVKVGFNAVIEDNVVIGDNTEIDHNVVIKQGVTIGRNCKIGPSSYISYALVGDNTIIHPGVRIGTDGFGFATNKGIHHKILHIGSVIIGNNVEIGANTSIDRGSNKDTVIGSGTIIDNLVQIGHNVQTGKGCVIVAQVGIAGSTTIGDYVSIGGQAGLAGHLNIANLAQIAAQSGVIRDITEIGKIVGGTPSQPIRDWHKQTILLKKMINGS